MTTTSGFGARALLSGGTSVFAMAVAATMFASPAFAQDAAPEDPTAEPAATDASPEGDAIVVTGIRASLAQSEKLKKATPTIVESVSAEDIGKLPDVSIADSLARLPGVTAQRLEGRDQRLSIRGLGPDFGTTLLNGREQVTVGDNRGVEYDQYPSEFFRNVVVHKSASSNLVAAGIAGTVDLRMLRPLEQKETVAVSLRGQMNGMDKLNPDGERFGYRASATYVDQFANDTIGLAIGISSTSSPSQNERYAAWGFPTASEVGGNLILGGAKPYVQSNLLKRNGAVATLEFKPSDTWHMTIDALYSKFKETQRLRGIEFPINPGWGSGATVESYTVEDGLVTEAVLSGVVAVQRNDLNRRKADNLSLGVNNVFALNDRMNLTVDASWSKSNRTDFLLETYTGSGYRLTGATDTIKITANEDGTFDIVPTFDYSNPANVVITDPRGWGWNGTTSVVQAGFLNQPKFKDDLKSLRAAFDGDIEGAFFNKWEVGANFSRRSKDSLYESYFLCPTDGNNDCTVSGGSALEVPIPAEAVIGSVALDYLGVPAMIALDPDYVFDNLLDKSFDDRPDSLARDYNVTENVFTGYVNLGIQSMLGSIPLAGNLGSQIVYTKQSSSGRIARLTNGVVQLAPAEGGSEYADILPSASFALEPFDNFFVKTGFYKSMVRARMDQMRVTQTVNFDSSRIPISNPANSAFSSNGGNPALEPYRAWNADLSLEKYFRKGGYIALAAYYKKLVDFIDPNNSYIYDFADLAALLPPEIQAQLGTTLGRVSAPGNTGKGKIIGQELTLSLPFENFAPALKGFGFFGSVAHVKSKVKFANSNPVTVPGLSKWVGTAEAYYENSGFQARVSYRHRSDFLAELAGLSAAPEFRIAKPEGIVDAQIGYEFQPGSALEGASITLQGKNLTDRPFTTYEQGDPRLAREFQRYGRDFYLSLNYKF